MEITILLSILSVIFTFTKREALILYPFLLLKEPWTLFTSVFVHENLNHLMWNLLGLFFFGIVVERTIGKKNYIYLVLALTGFSATGYLLFSKSPYIGVVGISGVVYGLLAFFSVLHPRKVILTPIGPMKAYVATIGWIIVSMVLIFIGEGNIAYSGHLFGLLGGVMFAFAYKRERKIKGIYVLLSLMLPFLLAGVEKYPALPKVSFNCTLEKEIVGYNRYYKKYNCGNETIEVLVVPGEEYSLAESVNKIKYLSSNENCFEPSKIEEGKEVFVSGKCKTGTYEGISKFENGVYITIVNYTTS